MLIDIDIEDLFYKKSLNVRYFPAVLLLYFLFTNFCPYFLKKLRGLFNF